MRAPVLHQPLQPMTIEDIEILPPRAGEVHVRMVAAGVCHTCLNIIDGTRRGSHIRMPMVLGDEGAGVVASVGPGVTRVSPGDHVILSWAPTCGHCRQCARGRPALCENQPPLGFLADGTVRFKMRGEDVHHFGPSTYASEVVVPESCAIPITKAMPLEKAALIGCSVMTGIGAVAYTAGVPAGASLAVFGCGGVGLNAVQGGVLVSAYPIIAVDISDSKLEHARAMGATHLFNASQANLPGAIRAVTSGRGVEYAIIAVGNGNVVRQAMDSLSAGGTAVMLAFMRSGEDLAFDPTCFAARECRLIGSRYGSARPSDDFPRLVDLYLAGRLRIDQLISRTYGLEDINEAHRALAAGEVARSIIVY